MPLDFIKISAAGELSENYGRESPSPEQVHPDESAEDLECDPESLSWKLQQFASQISKQKEIQKLESEPSQLGLHTPAASKGDLKDVDFKAAKITDDANTQQQDEDN